MNSEEFFQQIEHLEAPWGSKTIHLPVFYYDAATLSAQFLAPIENVRQIIPSKRLHPLRVTPWHCVVNISTFAYRSSDVGAYNEVSIGVPVTLDEPSPLFVGTLRKVPEVLKVFIWRLPVTTAIARDAGIDLAGYPKFLADITFEQNDQWVQCSLREADQHILTLSGRVGTLKTAPRSRIQPMTTRAGYLLRSELVVSERDQMAGQGSSGVQFELGDHPIAQELRALKLGNIIGYQYAPRHQAILTPVIESFAL